MNGRFPSRRLTRRDLIKVGGGLLAGAAGSALASKSLLQPVGVARAESAAMPIDSVQGAVAAQAGAFDLHLAATDGWIAINAPPIPPFHPDNVAPAGLTTYIFGFRDVTGYTDAQVTGQKMKAQLAAPIWSLDQEIDFKLKISNLGLQIRPDLIDSHTVHFHGFRNAIPIFDGEPHSSVGTPITRNLVYLYRPHYPGTYMYHCHFEETEHVHMGMIGAVFIKPLLNQQNPGHMYAYNDTRTEYDREFVMVAHEIWSEAHWCDSHIQLPEWTDYKADLFLLNGRAYPDTLLPPGGGHNPVTGDLIGPPGRPDLRYQPVSSLVRANSGDRVLLRFVNLGYTELSMRLSGIRLRIVGRDAMPLVGPGARDVSFVTSTAPIGGGETADAIFVAPPFVASQALNDSVGAYNRYLLYNRALGHMSGGAGAAYAGQMTEVRIYAAGVPAQTGPNT
ncbi:MAG TPA: multicopper oxidase domain-containing protein [Anaerolineae bacterium]|nr:multicopper oxidase domain-containing protein [Anaerolineae bacterium]